VLFGDDPTSRDGAAAFVPLRLRVGLRLEDLETGADFATFAADIAVPLSRWREIRFT
jgi:hypothetical protein